MKAEGGKIAVRFPNLLVAFALALVWLQWTMHVSLEWSYNAQYAYGFLVPPLAAWLFWVRWPYRPAPEPLAPDLLRLVTLLTAGAALLLLPLRVLEEANPDWRLLTWIHALVALTLTLCVLAAAGGIRRMKWLAWPFLFLLVSTPWPTAVENTVVQSLMRIVALSVADMANLSGIPAVARGNLIDLPHGALGVSEACSGVRSIQASAMCAAFFAVLERLSWRRSLLLLILGASTAVLLNIGRTMALTLVAYKHGIGAVDEVHDPAGHLLVVAIFLSCWFFASRMASPGLPKMRNAPVHSSPAPRAVLFCTLLIPWVALIGVGTELWYRSGSGTNATWRPWAISLPVPLGEPVNATVQRILRCDSGHSTRFPAPDGTLWTFIDLRWKPGSTIAQMARSHSPEICLQAAGLTMVEKSEPLTMRIGQIPISFERYIFRQRETPLFVFFCVWEPSSMNPGQFDPSNVYDVGNRLTAVLERRRLVGQQVIEIAIEGATNLEQATESVRTYLPLWIHMPNP